MWEILSIFLQATGVLMLLWTLVGWLVLGHDRGGAVVYRVTELSRVEAFLRCCQWLRGIGMIRMPVLLVDGGLDSREREELEHMAAVREDVRICTGAGLEEELKWEAERFGGAGAAAGNRSGGCVSES